MSKKKPKKKASKKAKPEIVVTQQFRQKVRSLAPPYGDGVLVGMTKKTGIARVRLDGSKNDIAFGTVALEFLGDDWKDFGLKCPNCDDAGNCLVCKRGKV